MVIHEVGHNFFPMIVNSDERQWTWMDEGFNTFLQYLGRTGMGRGLSIAARRTPSKIVPYMRGGNQRPIMTGSEEILQFGTNAYSKPATALNILRETILGRELFDFAFREIRSALEIQATDTLRFLSHHGRCVGCRSGLVLARMVLQHRPCRHRDRQASSCIRSIAAIRTRRPRRKRTTSGISARADREQRSATPNCRNESTGNRA